MIASTLLLQSTPFPFLWGLGSDALISSPVRLPALIATNPRIRACRREHAIAVQTRSLQFGRVTDRLRRSNLAVTRSTQSDQIGLVVALRDPIRDDVVNLQYHSILRRCFPTVAAHSVSLANRNGNRWPFRPVLAGATTPTVVLWTSKRSKVVRVHKEPSRFGVRQFISRNVDLFAASACARSMLTEASGCSPTLATATDTGVTGASDGKGFPTMGAPSAMIHWHSMLLTSGVTTSAVSAARGHFVEVIIPKTAVADFGGGIEDDREAVV